MTDRGIAVSRPPTRPPRHARERTAGPVPGRTARAPGRRFWGAVTLAAALLVAVGVGAGLLPGGSAPADGRVAALPGTAPMTGEASERVARRVSAAHADVTAVWRHEFRWTLGRAYDAPELVHFARNRPSPCAGTAGRSGPFYCARDRTISFDLDYLAGVAAQMRAMGDMSIATLVAQVAAEHVRAELGRPAADPDFEADCLAGVWVAKARRRMERVTPATWERIVVSARLVSSDAAAAAGLAAGRPAARAAAFAEGHAGGRIAVCLGAEI